MTLDRHAPEARPNGPAVLASDSRDPLSGRVLDGRYRVGARIARGGMATVYEATDLRLDRAVAVKVMHAGLGNDEEFAARFVGEARSAARLSHPNIVSVFDQGTDHGVVFLAMELVSGRTLRDVINDEAPMSPTRALALLDPVVAALAAAHRAGLVHRDVKPENVLIATDPTTGATRVKVADFGLAKAVSTTTQHTATGVLVGTVSYVAPELVVEGRSDARADVYAVGVIGYELLTGRKPHQGETPIQVAYKHVHEDVPPPSRLVPGLPAYVDALVARATARDRQQRPADAGVLLHQLHQVEGALAAGVHDDPDLVADLVPRARPAEPALDLEAVRSDTSPDRWDEGMAALLAAEPTTRTAPETPASPVRPQRRRRTPPPAGRPRPRRPRRSRRGPLLLVLALLAAAAVGTGAWWFGYARYTPTPGVIGLTRTQAEHRLEQAGLHVRLGRPTYSDTVAKGRILATDPGAGDRVLDGGTVTITLSLGREVYQLPLLTGITEDQAQDRILTAKMTFGSSHRRWSETVPSGIVISSDPAAGATLRPGAVVDLVVSKGRRPIPVGDWVGKSATDAVAVLQKRHLDPITQQEYSDTVPAGDVIRQAPAHGTLFRGDTVHLVVSRGPELVEVPSTRAEGIEAATAELEDLGFHVRVEHAAAYLALGYVFSSDPGAGAQIPKGSTITLFIV